MSYADVEALLERAHADDDYFPYVGRDFTLHGVLHRALLDAAVDNRRALWAQDRAADFANRTRREAVGLSKLRGVQLDDGERARRRASWTSTRSRSRAARTR